MASEGTSAKSMAEALFKKQGFEGIDEVRRAQEVERQAEIEKTARLRALRLAREEAERIAAEVRRARRERRQPR